MTAKSKRFFVTAGIASLLGIAAMLVLGALRDNIVFFYTPSEIIQSDRSSLQQLRLGGLVKDGTVKIEGMQSVFIVTDGNVDITVRYNNALPSLFREGQGVVAEGQIENGIFMAQNVLAKHDENYMPAEVADKLKQQGVWQGGASN
ncbi:MAG: cytochrome c maturation protein CcmE [Pseudomonadota bacterium]|jgi:cytochrome c-type biogenesis protein CcmE|nr:cytochrome c maturation protein CcmE [Pseudomonadota bacterium]|tara:strand:- start:115 stop:552 length:438 start_codon:yes stop_codon:yes gene_type:complete